MKTTNTMRMRGDVWSAADMQVREMMRDEAANDTMTAREREAMMAWAQERMSDPAWRKMAVAAMVHAQRRMF